MRNYVPSWEELGISKARYRELLEFCHQFPEWEQTVTDLDRAGLQESDQRRFAAWKLNIIHSCAMGAGPAWAAALISNICFGIPHNQLDPAILPSANRGAFFKVRRDFFALLNQRRI